MSAEAERSTPLSNVDTAWLRMEDPTNLMTITGVMLFDEPLDFSRLKATIRGRLLRFGRFTRRVAKHEREAPYWDPDPNFDLSAHVHHIALPPPGDQAALWELIGDMMSAPLDFSKPLWQVHLIDRYGSGCALLFRLHHCVGDGVALRHVILSLLDEHPDAPVSVPAPKKPRRRPDLLPLLRPATQAIGAAVNVAQQLLHEGKELVTHPAHALELAGMGVSGAAALGKLVLMSPDPKTILKGRLGVAKRAAWSNAMPLADVKAIGRVTGGTVNDVCLTAISGALRRYMLRRGAAVEDVRFRAVIPVNLLPPDAAPDGGNHFGLVFATLPIDLDDQIERIAAIKYEMNAIKQSPEAVVAFGLLNAMGMTAGEIERLAVDFFQAKATAVITNVVGPGEQLYLAGAPIRNIMFWVPQAGRLGVGISILSFAGVVQLGIATDAGLVPDPETIVADLHEEFAQLMELAKQAEADNHESPHEIAERYVG